MKQQKGQALILVALAMLALVGLTALAIDGGNAFAVRREAQNASDAAAYAAAYASIKDENINAAANAAATNNNFTDDGLTTETSLATEDVTAEECNATLYAGKYNPAYHYPSIGGTDYKYTVTAIRGTWFGGIVGAPTVTNKVVSTVRRCNFEWKPLFFGNAVVGLNPSQGGQSFSYHSSGNANWNITGGGIYANGNIYFGGNTGITAPGYTYIGSPTVNGNPGIPSTSVVAPKGITFPDEVEAMLPANPCTTGGIGIADPNGNNINGSVTFTNGVYCISNFDKYDNANIILNNATLYITDPDYSLKFTQGGFVGSGITTGPFAGYAIVAPLNMNNLCEGNNNSASPRIDFHGSSSNTLVGTIMLPNTCIHLNGNSGAITLETQIVGYQIYTEGTNDFSVNYNAGKNASWNKPPIIQLLK